VDVRGVPEDVDNLEGSCHLAGDAVGVDRVDDGHRSSQRQIPYEGEGGVEVPLDLDHRGAVNERLRQLAECDVPLGYEHRAPHAGARRVGGG
jgi:hypothetical protein